MLGMCSERSSERACSEIEPPRESLLDEGLLMTELKDMGGPSMIGVIGRESSVWLNVLKEAGLHVKAEWREIGEYAELAASRLRGCCCCEVGRDRFPRSLSSHRVTLDVVDSRCLRGSRKKERADVCDWSR